MIHIFRHKTFQRVFFGALAVLIVPGFVMIGGMGDKSGLSGTAGEIGKHKIAVQEFIRNYEAMRRELEVFGGVDPSMLDSSIDFEALAWQRILLVKAAKETGIKITDAEVVDWLQKQKVFEDNGAFSQERYQLILDRYIKMAAKQFEEEVREYLSLQQYRDRIRGDVKIGESDLQNRYRQLYGPRALEYVIFTKDSVAAPVAATEAELKEMYDRLSGRLFNQESVQVRYLTAPVGTAPADAAAAQWDAESVRTPLISKEDVIPGIGAAPKLSEAVFALKNAGDRTGWLEHDGKQYRFELIERKPQSPMAYDDAKKVLEQLVQQQKMVTDVTNKATAFRKDLTPDAWSKKITNEKLAIQTAVAYVPGDYIEKVGKLPGVAQALSELDKDGISEPLPTSNGLAIFRVISQADPDAKNFEAHRAEIEKDLRLKHEIEVFGKAMKALELNLKTNPTVLAKLFPTKYGEVPSSK